MIIPSKTNQLHPPSTDHPTPADRFRGHLAISGHSGDTGGGCHDGDSTTTVTSGLGLETGTIDDESSYAGNCLIPGFFGKTCDLQGKPGFIGYHQ
jgi:hypothetical protein